MRADKIKFLRVLLDDRLFIVQESCEWPSKCHYWNVGYLNVEQGFKDGTCWG